MTPSKKEVQLECLDCAQCGDRIGWVDGKKPIKKKTVFCRECHWEDTGRNDVPMLLEACKQMIEFLKEPGDLRAEDDLKTIILEMNKAIANAEGEVEVPRGK